MHGRAITAALNLEGTARESGLVSAIGREVEGGGDDVVSTAGAKKSSEVLDVPAGQRAALTGRDLTLHVATESNNTTGINCPCDGAEEKAVARAIDAISQAAVFVVDGNRCSIGGVYGLIGTVGVLRLKN